jgi:hypothetical protein
MIQLRDRKAIPTRPLPGEAVLSGPKQLDGRVPAMLRTVGAIAVGCVLNDGADFAHEPVAQLRPLQQTVPRVRSHPPSGQAF